MSIPIRVFGRLRVLVICAPAAITLVSGCGDEGGGTAGAGGATGGSGAAGADATAATGASGAGGVSGTGGIAGSGGSGGTAGVGGASGASGTAGSGGAAGVGGASDAGGMGGAGGVEPDAGSGATSGSGGSSGQGGSAGSGGTGGQAGTGGDGGDCEGGSQVDFSLMGWATQGGDTTGGKFGDTVTVTNGEQLAQALSDKQDSGTPLTILVNGTITEGNSGDISKFDVKEVEDVSVIGAGSGAELSGIGIKIFRASNIVVRNLKIHHVLIGDKDAISIEGPADHIWIDHCELYAEYEGVEKDYYDGLLDAKAEAEYITYSWNYLHDSWKSSLVGSGESDTYDRKITMHHNYYQSCYSRVPLFRSGNGHLFNNYYVDIVSTGVNSRVGACLRVENNYFSNAHNPWVSAYSDVLGGVELICNVTTDGSSFDYSSGDISEPLECTAQVPYSYTGVLNHVDEVPNIVMANAGVGKLEDPTDF